MKNKQINIEAEKKKKADKEAKKLLDMELRKKEENEQKLREEQQKKLKQLKKESENYNETYSEEAQLEEFNSDYFAQQTDKEIFLDYLDMILDEINDFYDEPSLENYVGVDKSIIEFLDNEYKYKYFDGHGELFKLTLKWRFDKNKFNEIRLPFNSIITEKRAIKLKFDTIFDEFVKEVLVFYKATFKVLIDIVKNNFEKALAIVLNKYHVPEKIISVDEILDKLNNNKNNSDRHIILKELFIQEKNIENNDTKSLISTNAKILYYLPLLKEINEMYLTHGKGLLIYFIVEIICLKYQFVAI
uniref:Uncharacterized protein n=1 Tax=Meloidogyne javanica TaxID=6303 RepID=A0A915N4C5_MELJA